MKVLFWAKKYCPSKTNEVPLMVRITINKDRQNWSSGITVEANKWNAKLQKVKGRGELSKAYNQSLEKIKADLIQCYNELSEVFTSVTAKDVKTNYKKEEAAPSGLLEIFEVYNARIKQLIGKEYSEETWLLYERTKRIVFEFIKHKWNHHDIRLDRLKRGFVEEFIFYLKTEKAYQSSTSGKMVQRLNTVINYAVIAEYIDRNPLLGVRVKKEKKPIVYLSPAELDRLEKQKFSIKRLEYARDLFLFCCWTSLPYSSLRELSYEHIKHKKGGELWVEIHRIKTKKLIRMILLPKAKELFDKYKCHTLDLKRKVFKTVSVQKYNKMLKQIADVCEIDKNISSHVSRCVFASSIMLSNDVPVSTISQLLTHSDMKVTTNHYLDISHAQIERDMEELQRKLSS